MTRLQTLIAEAEATLPEAERARLAEYVESLLAAQSGDDLFSAEELAELKLLDAEPEEYADPEEVAAVLAGRA